MKWLDLQVLLGDMGTGKSSLVLRFVKGQFFEYQTPLLVHHRVLIENVNISSASQTLQGIKKYTRTSGQSCQLVLSSGASVPTILFPLVPP
eukprot:3256193-Pyramimonas_sp.AAC.3